jgi:hypothetical protein
VGPSHRPSRRSHAQASGAVARGRGAGRPWGPGSVPTASRLPGKPRPRGFPKEDRGRRPPPAPSSPCHVWSCRRRPPVFRRGKAAVSQGFRPIELALGVQLRQEPAPHLQPHAWGFPVPEAPPAGTGGRQPRRHVLPSGTASQAPEEAFEDRPMRDGFRAAAWRGLECRSQGSALVPLRLREFRLCSSPRWDSFRC